jgi:hypothetical protein
MVNAGGRARPGWNPEWPQISRNMSHCRAGGATEIGVK